MPPAHARRFVAGLVTVGLVTVVGVLAGCSGDDPQTSSGEPFCDELRVSGLTTLEITDVAGATATAQRFERLAPRVPAEIRDEWGSLTELFRTVGNLDPADPGFRTAVLAEVGRTVTAASEVTSWAQRRCDLDLSAGATPTAPAPG